MCLHTVLFYQAKPVFRLEGAPAYSRRLRRTVMATSDAQKSEVHHSTDDASTAPTSDAGQKSGDAKKDVDRNPDDLTPPGRQPGSDRVSEGHRSGRGE